MIKPSSIVNMGDSLSPWEYQNDRSLINQQIYLKPSKKIEKNKQKTNKRLVERRQMNSRAPSAVRPLSKNVIKLQNRVSTQIVTYDDKRWETQLKQISMKNKEFIIKVPFKSIPPKKNSEKGTKKTEQKSQRNSSPMLQERISYRNFKQQIEQLDRLKSNKQNQISINHFRHSSSTNKLGGETMKLARCSLKSIRMFENDLTKQPQGIAKLKKIGVESKKHILDRILSRFQ